MNNAVNQRNVGRDPRDMTIACSTQEEDVMQCSCNVPPYMFPGKSGRIVKQGVVRVNLCTFCGYGVRRHDAALDLGSRPFDWTRFCNPKRCRATALHTELVGF